jgi:hypothetical protein
MLDVSGLTLPVLAGCRALLRHLHVFDRPPATSEGGGFRLPPGSHI